MRIFDTHFHFYGESTPLEFMRTVEQECAMAAEKLKLADRAVEFFLTAVGGDYVESVRSREFASVTPHCWFAVGVHPHQASCYLASREDFAVFRGDPRLVAVGELGLDYFYDQSARDEQQRVFEEFLNLALAWNLPAVVHLRDKDGSEAAYSDGLALLKPFASAGGLFVVHCYAGSREYMEKFLELGAYVGVTGMVTFRAAENIRRNAALIPADRLLIETDSPYLAPVPFRGRENTPGLLPLAAGELARTRGVGIDELAELTMRNAFRFFRISEDQNE